MTRQQATILSRVLPIVFWTLAVTGTVGTPFLLEALNAQYPTFNASYWWGYLPTAAVLTIIVLVERIDRHGSSVEECFLSGLLLGASSYFLPTIICIVIPLWGYLIYRNLFSLRSLTSTLIGFAAVAILAAAAIIIGWISNPWASFWALEQLWGWIPLGAVLVAWLASTIARQILRVR